MTKQKLFYFVFIFLSTHIYSEDAITSVSQLGYGSFINYVSETMLSRINQDSFGKYGGALHISGSWAANPDFNIFLMNENFFTHELYKKVPKNIKLISIGWGFHGGSETLPATDIFEKNPGIKWDESPVPSKYYFRGFCGVSLYNPFSIPLLLHVGAQLGFFQWSGISEEMIETNNSLENYPYKEEDISFFVAPYTIVKFDPSIFRILNILSFSETFAHLDYGYLETLIDILNVVSIGPLGRLSYDINSSMTKYAIGIKNKININRASILLKILDAEAHEINSIFDFINFPESILVQSTFLYRLPKRNFGFIKEIGIDGWIKPFKPFASIYDFGIGIRANMDGFGVGLLWNQLIEEPYFIPKQGVTFYISTFFGANNKIKH